MCSELAEEESGVREVCERGERDGEFDGDWCRNVEGKKIEFIVCNVLGNVWKVNWE